jgi:hypothetical protein
MKVICTTLWFRLIPVLTHIGEILLLNMSVNHSGSWPAWEIHSLVTEFILSWEDTSWISGYCQSDRHSKYCLNVCLCLYWCENKYTVFVCMDIEKNQTLNKYIKEIFMFSPHMCQIEGHIEVHKGFIKYSSENSIVNVKLIETYIYPYICLYHGKL